MTMVSDSFNRYRFLVLLRHSAMTRAPGYLTLIGDQAPLVDRDILTREMADLLWCVKSSQLSTQDEAMDVVV